MPLTSADAERLSLLNFCSSFDNVLPFPGPIGESERSHFLGLDIAINLIVVNPNDPFWQADFWSSDFWADNFWFGLTSSVIPILNAVNKLFINIQTKDIDASIGTKDTAITGKTKQTSIDGSTNSTDIT